MTPANRFRWVAILLVLATGCADSSLPARAPVTGIVTYRGQPLPSADVTFLPEGGAQAATGRTDAAGRYTLGTYAIGDGALLGRHRITVLAHGPDRPLRPGETGSGIPGELTRGDPLIPTKYFAGNFGPRARSGGGEERV